MGNPAERRAADILESLADPVVAIDKQWRYTYVSRRAAQALGKAAEEMIGKSMWELFPDDADTGFQEACRRAWAESKPVTIERYSKVLGTWVESYIYPFADGASTQWRDIGKRKRAEEALSASEARNRFLADLLQASAQPFALGYADGRIGFVNAAFEQLTGYSGQELRDMDWRATLTPAEWREPERTALEELQRTGRPVRYEKEYLRKDGTRVPIELLVHLATDEQGQPLYYSFITDLTGRKRVERENARIQQQIEAQRALLQTLLTNTLSAISLVRGSDLRFQLINPAYQAIAPGKEIAGRTLREVWPELHPVLEQIFTRVLETGEPFHAVDAEYLIQRSPAGPPETAYFTWSLARVRLPGEEGWGVVNTAVETTGRVKAAEKLEAQRQWLRVTLDSIGDAVLATDTEGRIVFLNPVAAALIGWTEEQALHQLARDVFQTLNEDTGQPAEDIIGRVLREQRVISMANHTALLARDGREIPIEDSAAPILDSAGHLLGVVLVFRDVTEKRRAQEKVRESEALWRAFFESPGVMRGIVEIIDGRIVHVSCNADAAELFGLERESLPGKSAAEAGASEEVERLWIDLYEESRRTGKPVSRQYSRLDRTGRERWLLATGTHLGTGPSGNPRCVYAMVDVSSAKVSEQALRESEERFRTLANAIPQLCWIANADGWTVWYNQRWYEYTGTTPEQMEGWGWQSVHDPSVLPEVMERWQHSLRAGKPFDMVFPLRGADGVFRPFLTRIMPLYDSSGRLTRWFGTNTDITEQRRYEEALRESEARAQARAAELEAVLDAVPAVVFVSNDPECRHMVGSRMTYEILRMPPGSNVSKTAEGEGRAPAFRAMKDGREIPPPELPAQKAAATAQPVRSFEFEVVLEDETRRNLLGDAVPLFAENGRPRGAVAAFIDITERKQTEERLRQAQKLESIGLLAGGIAHDFNNLLTGIMGNASMLLAEVEPGNTGLVQEIVQSARRAADLTRQLLAYSGKGRFILRDLDVSQAVSDVADLVQSSIPKSAALALTLERRLPVVKMDPGQLQQILMNLVINAGEAIGEGNPGRITVATSVTHVAAAFTDAIGQEVVPGRYVCIEVSDTGSGIANDNRSRIFDPFFTTKFTGRGLGLAAVAGIVRSQKGAITLESVPGHGSTFRVLLPVAEQGRQPEAAPPEPGRGTILVVDDEPAIRTFISAALRRQKYRVLTSAGGREAIDTCAAESVDVIILDVVMPSMAANEVVLALKSRQPQAGILLTSGYSESDARNFCTACPDAKFIQKPYTAQQIAEAVDEMLKAR